jgi:hypothetical protein
VKKEVSPAIFITVIVVAVLVIGLFLFRQASNNPPTPRPNPKYFGGVSSGPSFPQSGAAPASQGR